MVSFSSIAFSAVAVHLVSGQGIPVPNQGKIQSNMLNGAIPIATAGPPVPVMVTSIRPVSAIANPSPAVATQSPSPANSNILVDEYIDPKDINVTDIPLDQVNNSIIPADALAGNQYTISWMMNCLAQGNCNIVNGCLGNTCGNNYPGVPVPCNGNNCNLGGPIGSGGCSSGGCASYPVTCGNGGCNIPSASGWSPYNNPNYPAGPIPYLPDFGKTTPLNRPGYSGTPYIPSCGSNLCGLPRVTRSCNGCVCTYKMCVLDICLITSF